MGGTRQVSFTEVLYNFRPNIHPTKFQRAVKDVVDYLKSEGKLGQEKTLYEPFMAVCAENLFVNYIYY